MDPLGAVMIWMAQFGLVGLILVSAAERFAPVVPSYGILVAIGIAAAAGTWSVEGALFASILGSLIGCLLLYGIAFALGQERAHRMVYRAARLCGISAARVDGMIAYFHSHEFLLAFGSQLVPTVRLLSPAIAGLFRADTKGFAIATAAGVGAWNSLFIIVGHAAVSIAPSASASIVAINVLIALLVIEGLIGLTWRCLSKRAQRGEL